MLIGEEERKGKNEYVHRMTKIGIEVIHQTSHNNHRTTLNIGQHGLLHRLYHLTIFRYC